ncbi:MAG: L7Ae/L30e/S12e/Gadd45 family ribosomal protein [Oscillospiraceae bacterium]
MNWQQKTINLLTICKKAGKLVIGFDAVKASFFEDKVFCVLVAKDISENTLKKITIICKAFAKRNVPIIKTSLTVAELETYLGQKMAVAAVCDRGFAKRFAELDENL